MCCVPRSLSLFDKSFMIDRFRWNDENNCFAASLMMKSITVMLREPNNHNSNDNANGH